MIKLILMAALLFVSGASMAQRVVVGANGEAIIDCRAMPANSITTKKKALTTDATNATMGTNDLNNLASVENNKTVSHYFEVTKGDIERSNWLVSMNSCMNYKSGDGNDTWRAPTQRELMLLWALQESLLRKVPGYPPLATSANIWSATEFPGNEVTFLSGGYGTEFVTVAKDYVAYIRCVRDLDPQ